MSNPFGPATPAAPAPAHNPYAQPAPAAPAPGGNPFGAAPAHLVQPAAPAYAPPVQPAAPAYAPPAAPAAPAYAPAAAPAPGAYGKPAAPTPSGGDVKIRDLYGRAVLAFPRTLKRGVVKSNFTDPRTKLPQVTDQMAVTFVVLTDPQGSGVMHFGGNPGKPPYAPHPHSAPLPFVTTIPWVENSKLIEQLEPFLPGGAAHNAGQPCTLGTVYKGPGENEPWVINPATPDDERIADYYLAGVQSGQFPNPLA